MSQSVSSFILKNLEVKTKSGFEWLCLCPYHEDKSPSFSFNIKKRLFVCFACGAKGNLRQLMEHLNVSADIRGEESQLSIDDVASKIAKTRDLLNSEHRPAVGVPYPAVYRDSDVAQKAIHDYWRCMRFMRHGQIERYKLGYDPINDHAIIPVTDRDSGVVVSLIRRRNTIEEGQSRYLYSKGTKISEMVFGAKEAVDVMVERGEQKTALVITEGAVDAMTALSVPITWDMKFVGVAVLGSRMSKAQGEIIKSIGAEQIYIATDMDRAGKIAQTQIATMLKDLRCGAIIRKINWDEELGKDLNSVFTESGTAKLARIFETAVSGTKPPTLFT